MERSHDRTEPLELLRRGRAELVVGARDELHAHARGVEPRARAPEVIQQRRDETAAPPEHSRLSRSLSAIGRGAGERDPYDDVLRGVPWTEIRDLVHGVAVAGPCPPPPPPAAPGAGPVRPV